jgi:DNA ligase-1
MLFALVCDFLEKVKLTTSKNAKVDLLAAMLIELDPVEAEGLVRLMVGYDAGIGWATISEAVLEITGGGSELVRLLRDKGDLGDATFELMKRGKKVLPLVATEITVGDLIDVMVRMKDRGEFTQKARLLTGLLLRASPIESKYIVKLLTRELRIGATTGLLEEAVAKATGYSPGSLRKAILMRADLSSITRMAKERRLHEIKPTLFVPIAFMLAEAAKSAKEAIGRFEKGALAEYKYDGIRAQIHAGPKGVMIISRRLEDVSPSFPELLSEMPKLGVSAILDGEILAYEGGAPTGFGSLQLRLHRKKVSASLLQEVPVHYFIFDVLFFKGEPVMQLPLRERRRILEGLILGSRIHVAPQFRVSTEDEVEDLFRESRRLGYEGLVLKDPESHYVPGRRGSRWIKMKRELDTIDAVVVAVEYGHGKRAGLLSDYTFAVRVGEDLKTIGKAYSGLTDREILEMTDYFKARVLVWRGPVALVKPDTVVEVAFDSIQESGRHTSGFALRFPRIKGIRWDKSPRDADTIDRVRSIYEAQTHVSRS